MMCTALSRVRADSSVILSLVDIYLREHHLNWNAVAPRSNNGSLHEGGDGKAQPVDDR